MEQLWAFITDNTLYVSAGYAAALLALALFSLHRINRSVRLQKKQMKKIQEILAVMESWQRQLSSGAEETTADDLEQGMEGQAVTAEGWTSEQEHLVNEVLGEVFS